MDKQIAMAEMMIENGAESQPLITTDSRLFTTLCQMPNGETQELKCILKKPKKIG